MLTVTLICLLYTLTVSLQDDLYQYLCVVAPFASLLDNSVSNTKLLMANG